MGVIVRSVLMMPEPKTYLLDALVAIVVRDRQPGLVYGQESGDGEAAGGGGGRGESGIMRILISLFVSS